VNSFRPSDVGNALWVPAPAAVRLLEGRAPHLLGVLRPKALALTDVDPRGEQ
jgi:hypothetical protein